MGIVAVADALFGAFRAEQIRNTDDDKLIFLKIAVLLFDIIIYERRLYLFDRNYALSIGIGSMYGFISQEKHHKPSIFVIIGFMVIDAQYHIFTCDKDV
ncbi:hypothetical protein CAPN003_18050 [Capnocytophaga stomatis]|nr:hypothetical protein CAPN003_18050 [Capnocytophaga stomatis]